MLLDHGILSYTQRPRQSGIGCVTKSTRKLTSLSSPTVGYCLPDVCADDALDDALGFTGLRTYPRASGYSGKRRQVWRCNSSLFVGSGRGNVSGRVRLIVGAVDERGKPQVGSALAGMIEDGDQGGRSGCLIRRTDGQVPQQKLRKQGRNVRAQNQVSLSRRRRGSRRRAVADR